MATAPTWQAAVAGQPPKASHIDQLLGPHDTVVTYNATQQAGQTTNGAAATSTNGLYLAQSFTTGAAQTTIGNISASLTTSTTTGDLLAPTTISLHANSGSAPAAPALVSTAITAEFAFAASGGLNTTRIGIPLPITGLTPSTTYWLVVAAAGSAGQNYTWFRSNQTSGASTSPNGTTWTAQSYGFTFTVQDQIPTGSQVKATWEDGGARWTYVTYTAAGLMNTYFEYTAGQTSAGYIQSVRTFAYSNGLPTSVS